MKEDKGKWRENEGEEKNTCGGDRRKSPLFPIFI